MIYEFAPWEYYPKFLASHEVKNPLLVITDFFSFDHRKGFKDQLKMWKSFAIAEEYYENQYEGTVIMVMRYEHNVRLVEAMYLLLLEYPSRDREAGCVSDEQLADEKEKWSWFPKNLSKEELKNPFKVLKGVFDDISMPKYRDQLHDWLTDALSVSSILMMYDKKDLKRLYRHQVRLYSVAWLFRQRETPYVSFKKAEEARIPAANSVTDEKL